MKERIVSIQLLRAMACIFVLAHHLCALNPRVAYRINGAVGVDIFFVVSGFIIAYSIERLPPISYIKTFLINRLSRVVPYYYIMTLLYLSIQFTIDGIHTSIVELGKSFLFIPMGFRDPILGSGWSLNHEILFYGFVSAAMLLTRSVKHIAILFITVLFFSQIIPLQHPFFRELRASINLEFAFGMLLYVVRDRLRFFYHWGWLIFACILVLAVVTHTIDAPGYGGMEKIAPINGYFRDSIYPFYYAIVLPRGLFYGIPAALLFATVVAHESALSHFKPNNILLRIGNASFTIYIIQASFMFLISYTHFTRLWNLLLFFGLVIGVSLLLVPLESLVARFTKRVLSSV